MGFSGSGRRVVGDGTTRFSGFRGGVGLGCFFDIPLGFVGLPSGSGGLGVGDEKRTFFFFSGGGGGGGNGDEKRTFFFFVLCGCAIALRNYRRGNVTLDNGDVSRVILEMSGNSFWALFGKGEGFRILRKGTHGD